VQSPNIDNIVTYEEAIAEDEIICDVDIRYVSYDAMV